MKRLLSLAALVIYGCSDPIDPADFSQPFESPVQRGAAVASDGRELGHVTVSRAIITVSRINISGVDPTADFIDGQATSADLNLWDDPTEVRALSLPLGLYDRLRMRVKGAGGPAVLIEGTVAHNGTREPFTFEADFSAVLDHVLAPPFEAPVAGTQALITMVVDPSGWFVGLDGAALDPLNPGDAWRIRTKVTRSVQDAVIALVAVPVAGKFALDFRDSWVTVPDDPALDLTDSWTLEAWIKPRNAGGGVQHVVSKWNGGGNASYTLIVVGGRLRSDIHDGVNPTQMVESIGSLSNDEWQHAAISFSNGTLRLYIDGTLDRTFTGSQTPMNSDRPLSFGREGPPYGGWRYDGLIDEVRIWNVERTASEIAGALAQRLAGDEPGLIGYWRFDEGGGDVATDATGHGHTGQLGNAIGSDANDPAWATDAAPLGAVLPTVLRWASLPDMPSIAGASVATTDGTRVYVLGGGPPGVLANLNQIYDPTTDSWSLGAAFVGNRAFAMAGALSDGIHLVGGVSQETDHQVYDRHLDGWSPRAPLPNGGRAGVAEVVKGKLYVIGGVTAGSNVRADVQIYDPHTDSWSMGAAMPTPRLSAVSTVIDGKIYVAGGEEPGFITSDDLELYDPATDSWTSLASLPAVRESMGGGRIGGEFCVFGGRLTNPSPTGNAFPETFCYDPSADSWDRGPDMITPRVTMGSVELNGTIYAIGGRTGSNNVATAERLVLH